MILLLAVGIDLGTTGCKAVVTNEKGKIVGQEYIEYPLIVLSEKEVEQDAALWWELACKAVKAAVENCGGDKKNVVGISVSSQGLSFLPVDKNVEPLCNAISWLDIRPSEQTEHILTKFSRNKIFQLTGKRVNEVYILPKLLWLRENKPDIYANAYKFLTAHDFLIAKMTGNFITDNTMASGSMMHDVSKCDWSKEILCAFDIDASKLPEIRYSGTSAGKLTKQAAEQMGLCEGIAVGVGGQDQKVAAYSLTLEIGSATLCLGTAGAMEFFVSKPVFDDKMGIPVFPYLFEKTWTLEAVISATGVGLKWLKNTFFADKSFKDLDDIADKSDCGCGGVCFYPHFGGATSPIWDTDAKAFFYGLSLNTTSGDIIRSVLEGVAFQIKSNLIRCEKLSGKIDTITVFGSGSKSDIWCRIISNITNCKVYALSTPDAAGIGAAKLGFCAAGMLSDDYAEDIMAGCRVYEPIEDCVKAYEVYYEKYIATENKMLG